MGRVRTWFLTDRNFTRDIIALYAVMMMTIMTACGQVHAEYRPHARQRITSGHETTVYVRQTN